MCPGVAFTQKTLCTMINSGRYNTAAPLLMSPPSTLQVFFPLNTSDKESQTMSCDSGLIKEMEPHQRRR